MDEKIRTADSRGRVSVNAQDGTAYVQHVAEDGTITLSPIHIPVPARLEGYSDMRAIYVSPSQKKTEPSTITIFSSFGGSVDGEISWIHSLAVALMVPVVVRATGIGSAYVDRLVELGSEVYQTFPGLKTPVRVASPPAEC